MQLLTAREVPLKATTPAPAQWRAACLGRGPTGAAAAGQASTQGPGPMPLRRKAPKQRELRKLVVSRTARLPIPGTRPPRKEQHRRCRLPRVAEVEPQWAQTVTRRCGTNGKWQQYAASNGNVYKNSGGGRQQTHGTLPEAGGNSRAAAVPRPSVEAAAADGNRGRRAPGSFSRGGGGGWHGPLIE